MLRFRWPSKLRYGEIGYGFGFYRCPGGPAGSRVSGVWGMWFGFGQIQFRRWGVDICLLMKNIPGYGRYNRFWFSLG